jgi:endonuclease YncB( thermonuclease family)
MKRSFEQPNLAHLTNLRARVGQIYPCFGLCLLACFLAACAQATPATPGALYRAETVVLPTGAPTAKPTPVNTRVIPITELTPGPTPTLTPLPDEVRALVVGALDGDTISVVLEGDPPGRTYTVRYLGIDAPPNTPSVPWGVVAFEVNEKLTNRKVVRLERDQSDTDDEGNLLRYVYLGEELLSITLAEQGLARAAVNEPDTRFRAEILDAEQRARAGNRGLWSNRPPTPTPHLVTSPTTAITVTTPLTVTTVPLETTVPETGSTAEPVVTTVVTPAGPVSPTTEPEATATVEPADEPSPTPATLEPTSESTPGSGSEGEGLSGPQ